MEMVVVVVMMMVIVMVITIVMVMVIMIVMVIMMVMVIVIVIVMVKFHLDRDGGRPQRVELRQACRAVRELVIAVAELIQYASCVQEQCTSAHGLVAEDGGISKVRTENSLKKITHMHTNVTPSKHKHIQT
jgi:ABC-type transport system involved in cytochrome bd biosynthesis fused ATPase/permease subunit